MVKVVPGGGLLHLDGGCDIGPCTARLTLESRRVSINWRPLRRRRSSTTRPTSAPRSTALSYALHDTRVGSWVEDADVSTAMVRMDQQFRGLEIAAAAREDVAT